MAFPTQHGVQTWSTKLAALFSQFSQPLAEVTVFIRHRLVTKAAPVKAGQLTGPSLAEWMRLLDVFQNVPSCNGCYHVFETTSLWTLLSSMVSAWAVCSLLQAVSGGWRQDTSMPPNLERQVQKVTSLMPCIRQRLTIFMPAWACFKMPMICSSVNRFFHV